jgi:MHS family proline/betaine transporter-like MFS transporter
MSVGSSLSVAIFGGFAPYIATWLTQQTGSPLAPTWYVAAAAVVTAIVVLRLCETAHSALA